MKIFLVISEINLLGVLRLGHRKRDVKGKRVEKQSLLKKKLEEDKERSDDYTEMSPHYGWW